MRLSSAAGLNPSVGSDGNPYYNGMMLDISAAGTAAYYTGAGGSNLFPPNAVAWNSGSSNPIGLLFYVDVDGNIVKLSPVYSPSGTSTITQTTEATIPQASATPVTVIPTAQGPNAVTAPAISDVQAQANALQQQAPASIITPPVIQAPSIQGTTAAQGAQAPMSATGGISDTVLLGLAAVVALFVLKG